MGNRVYLLGAGPGDPELLTLKAARLLREAGAVLYDALVASEILELCPENAEMIYVGKRASRHALPQEEINELLAQYSTKYSVVVRLKGGDPFIFGRGGEELAYLRERGIDCEVVPGITAATAAAASAGIPLTHRESTDRVVFLSGHTRKDALPDLTGIDPARDTIVVYMGVAHIGSLARALAGPHEENGRIPLIVVENASTPEEKIHHSCLSDAHTLQGKISAPAIIVIGKVCARSFAVPELSLSTGYGHF
ncbi:MAG: uroporphyrinogen-III C-methyltransferase [Spirochaetales bacterium]|nr:uroporphyrinogen-III C-methyltransferase [Spirochaetales bacterium]